MLFWYHAKPVNAEQACEYRIFTFETANNRPLLSKSLALNTQTDTIRYELGPCLYIAYVTGFIQMVLGVGYGPYHMEYEEVIQGRGKKMRSEVRYRHEKLYDFVKQFDEYNIVQKNAELIDTAIDIGWLMSSVNSKK